MSDILDSAPAAAPLILTDPHTALFVKRDDGKVPAIVTLPGSSSMNLKMFDVTATGSAKPEVPGSLTLTLYGRAKLDGLTEDLEGWLTLASSNAEPIGGETDLPEAMFMIRGKDLMANTNTGKLQGTFQSNIASSPYAPIDLDQHPGDLTEEDPLYVFTIGASFAPDDAAPPAKDGEDPPPLCTLTLVGLTLTA